MLYFAYLLYLLHLLYVKQVRKASKHARFRVAEDLHPILNPQQPETWRALLANPIPIWRALRANLSYSASSLSTPKTGHALVRYMLYLRTLF
jgi:hypothetical protein